MSDEIKVVEIRAELRQVKSMVDGTFNIVLNIPEDCREQVKVMIDWLGLEVRAVITNIANWTILDDETEKSTENNTSGMDRRRIGKRRNK